MGNRAFDRSHKLTECSKALEKALAEIEAPTCEPSQAIRMVQQQIARILAAVSKGGKVTRLEFDADLYEALLLEKLAQAGRHVTDTEGHIAKQQKVIATKEPGGHETAVSRELLDCHVQTRSLHQQYRRRLLCELASLRLARSSECAVNFKFSAVLKEQS
jgi:hypothetical protein